MRARILAEADAQILDLHVATVLLLAAAQGCDFHRPLASSPPLEAVRTLLADFTSPDQAAAAVSGIIAGGISAEACADALWDAVETDEEEVMMGGKEVFYERFKRYAPQLFSFALKRIAPKA